MQENLILAGYDEETAKRLSEALAGTLVPTKALIAALRGLTDATESLADMMRELMHQPGQRHFGNSNYRGRPKAPAK